MFSLSRQGLGIDCILFYRKALSIKEKAVVCRCMNIYSFCATFSIIFFFSLLLLLEMKGEEEGLLYIEREAWVISGRTSPFEVAFWQNSTLERRETNLHFLCENILCHISLEYSSPTFQLDKKRSKIHEFSLPSAVIVTKLECWGVLWTKTMENSKTRTFAVLAILFLFP